MPTTRTGTIAALYVLHSDNSSAIPLPQNRKDYVIQVYTCAALFVLLSAFQWWVIAKGTSHVEYFQENTYFTFAAAVSTLFLLTIFALFNDLRYNPSINLSFALCVVEGGTFSMLQIVLNSQGRSLVICFLVTAAISIGFGIFGVMLPLDITKLILPVLLISFTIYMIITVIIFIFITYGIYFPQWLFYAIINVLLIVYTMYNAQLISGTRAIVLRLTDFILPALLVYFTFIVMFVMVTSLYEYKLKANWPFD